MSNLDILSSEASSFPQNAEESSLYPPEGPHPNGGASCLLAPHGSACQIQSCGGEQPISTRRVVPEWVARTPSLCLLAIHYSTQGNGRDIALHEGEYPILLCQFFSSLAERDHLSTAIRGRHNLPHAAQGEDVNVLSSETHTSYPLGSGSRCVFRTVAVPHIIRHNRSVLKTRFPAP